MKPLRNICLALVLLTALSGCGNTTMGRMATGAGIGAVAGATGAIAFDGNPFTGALIGGVAGGLVGALSDREINARDIF
jgi:hypothetical protein